MAERDIIIMRSKEIKRLYVVKNVLCKKISWKEAAEFLELSIR